VLHASVQGEEQTAACAEKILETVARRAYRRPVTKEELELGRASLTRGYPRNFETADQIARGAAQLALYDLPDDYFTTFVPKVMALTEQDVIAVAAKHLDPDRLLTVVVGDREKILASLKQEFGDVAELNVT
jgi:zinc protease